MSHLRKISPIKYSVVIPVYNSEGIVGETIDRTVVFFQRRDWSYELILVNDGSKDKSWEILVDKAHVNANIIAVNLARNYGQHSAIFCGIHLATGDYVINMDDDLQNPPEELDKLIAKASEGYDVVFAKFIVRRHRVIRRVGSRVISVLDRFLFKKPNELSVTNFRIFQREVADRIRAFNAPYPYLRGLLLKYGTNPVNVDVEHYERAIGSSNYTPLKIFSTLMRIFFNFSVGSPWKVFAWGAAMIFLPILLFATNFRTVPDGSRAIMMPWLVFSAWFIYLLTGLMIMGLGILGWILPRSYDKGIGLAGYTATETIMD